MKYHAFVNSVQLGLGATQRKETTKRRSARRRLLLSSQLSCKRETESEVRNLLGLLRNRTWSAKNSGHGSSDDDAAGIDKN